MANRKALGGDRFGELMLHGLLRVFYLDPGHGQDANGANRDERN
jgi:hypothetical protein